MRVGTGLIVLIFAASSLSSARPVGKRSAVVERSNLNKASADNVIFCIAAGGGVATATAITGATGAAGGMQLAAAASALPIKSSAI